MDYSTYGQTEWATDSASATGFSRGVVRNAVADFNPETRFAAVYHLLSVTMNHRLRLRVFLDETKPIVDSVVPVWNGVDWFERDIWILSVGVSAWHGRGQRVHEVDPTADLRQFPTTADQPRARTQRSTQPASARPMARHGAPEHRRRSSDLILAGHGRPRGAGR